MGAAALINIGGTMPLSTSLRILAAAFGVTVLCLAAYPAMAQSGGAANDKSRSAPDNPREGQRKADEIAEAARVLSGPAGNPECTWIGRRVVSLLWRDDLDTAARHLDLYDRFACPGDHIQATFRCLIRQGHIDPKAPESLNGRVHACWLNPAMTPAPAADKAAAGTAPAAK